MYEIFALLFLSLMVAPNVVAVIKAAVEEE